MDRVMLVDDAQGRIAELEQELAGPTRQVITARLDNDVVARIRQECPHAVVMVDCSQARQHGDPMVGLQRWDCGLPVILVGEAGAGMEATIEAIKRGAMDYISWPVDTDTLSRRVDLALRHSRLSGDPGDGAAGEPTDETPQKLIGRSEPMQRVCKLIGRVAREDVSVLVIGESGTGKELVARAIHQHSSRAAGPFLAINCAALPEPLLESELFGHEQGAFTGADRRRVGKFQQADGGTLLLDELGDMSPAIQAKFLRILQDGCFQRLGGTETLHADVRVIAATNQDLEAKIESGEFRSDLYWRLCSFTIPLPPLRRRREDLPLLIDHFIQLANQRMSQRALRVSDEALALLTAHHWPGNIRELHSAITYAVVHAVAEVITPESLPESCRGGGAGPAVDDTEMRWVGEVVRRRLVGGQQDIYRELLQRFDAAVVEATLQHVGGNQVAASRRLGVSRNTLRAKLRRAAG